jgi:hypothetical protein
MQTISGGCACGKVRLRAEADPVFTAVCHCRACQRAGGGAFAVIVALPASSLRIDGIVATYDSVGDSGKGKHYRFCPSCGSPVASNVDVMPDLMMIRAGILDDTDWVNPSMEIYCGERQQWAVLASDRTRFDTAPG